MLRRHLRTLAAVAALCVAVPLTACGGEDKGGSASSSGDLPKGELSFAHVEQAAPEAFKSEKRCATGQWSDGKSEVGSELESQTKSAQQYDCGDPNAPEFSEIGMYVEFTDEEAAKAFAKDEAMYGQVLRDGTKVFSAGALIDTVKFRELVEEVKASCECGEISGGTVSPTS